MTGARWRQIAMLFLIAAWCAIFYGTCELMDRYHLKRPEPLTDRIDHGPDAATTERNGFQ